MAALVFLMMVFILTVNDSLYGMTTGSPLRTLPDVDDSYNVDQFGCGCGTEWPTCITCSFAEYMATISVPEPICLVVQIDLGYFGENFVSSERMEMFAGLKKLQGFRGMRRMVREVSVENWLRHHCNNSDPDAVIFSEPFSPLSADLGSAREKEWMMLAKRIPFFVVIDDIHYHNVLDGLRYSAAFRRSFQIFATYAYLIPYWFPDVREEKCVWLPHSAGRRFYYESLNSSAESSILVSGDTRPYWYPCRYAVLNSKLSKRKQVSFLPHPDPTYNGKAKNHVYSRHLRKYRFALATSSINYVVAKFFEIPSTGCAVIIDNFVQPIVEALGFKKHENYFGFDCDMSPGQKGEPKGFVDLKALSDIIHLDRTMVDKVRHSGMALVHNRHTVTHRVWQLCTRVMAEVERAKRRQRTTTATHRLGSMSEHQLSSAGICFRASRLFPHDWPPFLKRFTG